MQRSTTLAACALLLFACKKTPAPATGDASIVAADTATASSSGGLALKPPFPRANDAAALAPLGPPLPLASESLELVAVGKKFATKIVWLNAHGSRVWLSGMGLDAYADGDGPLTAAPDLLKGLPYDPKKHSLQITGVYPALFALRTKDVNGRIESPEATVFVLRDGAWTQAKPLGRDHFPHAFVAWNGGALIVDSQIELNAEPYYMPNSPGTVFTFVAADGTVTHPSLGLEPTFMAWNASSDGTTLSIIGTRGLAPKGKEEGASGSRGIVVVRGKDKGAFQTTALLPQISANMIAYETTVREQGAAALLWQPEMAIDEDTWKGANENVYVIADGVAKPRKVRAGAEQDCVVREAALASDVVYARVECYGDKGVEQRLVRMSADGKRARVALPLLAKNEGGGFRVAHAGETPFACTPTKLVVRVPDDLWIQAECGGTGTASIAAVFRRGRPQEPIVLP